MTMTTRLLAQSDDSRCYSLVAPFVLLSTSIPCIRTSPTTTHGCRASVEKEMEQCVSVYIIFCRSLYRKDFRVDNLCSSSYKYGEDELSVVSFKFQEYLRSLRIE